MTDPAFDDWWFLRGDHSTHLDAAREAWDAAIKHEREACAIMCEVHAACIINDGKQPAWAIAHECAAAIRNRKETT